MQLTDTLCEVPSGSHIPRHVQRSLITVSGSLNHIHDRPSDKIGTSFTARSGSGHGIHGLIDGYLATVQSNRLSLTSDTLNFRN
jgi:hypothetical protein